MKLEFHHINFVAEDVDRMHRFYVNVLGLDDIAAEQFPRTQSTETQGYDGTIRFATEGAVQFHLAERDFQIAFRVRTH